MIMKRFRAHIRPLLLTCVIVLFFVSLLNITTSFAQDTPFARLKTGYGSAPILSLSPDGKTLATSAETSDDEVLLWDVATGKRLWTLEHPINRRHSTLSGINFISFISDRTLLSATDTSSICLWDVSETFSFGTLLKREDVPGDRTTDFLLSPDGQTLAYYAYNDWRERSVYLWDISTGTLLKKFHNCSDVFSFSRDSQTFLTHCGTRVDLWDVSDSKFLASFDTEFEDQVSAMSPDGKTLVLTGRHTRLLRTLDLWDVSEDTLLQKIGIYSSIGDISFSPDGQTLAVSSSGTVDLWDISTGALRNTFKHSELDSYNPPHILFSPDGHTLLSGLPDVHGYAGLGLWDVTTGRLRNVFQASTEARSISFIWDAQIPGGQILAAAHKTRTGGLYSRNIWEILLWRVEPAVPAEPEPVAAKSLLEEFIGLKDPFAAVAGVAPPVDILDAADATNLRVNWEDIAGIEDYEGNESLDVNQDGSVNKRDLQLVEFALTLDTDGDGTLSAQEMVSPHESPDLVVESISGSGPGLKIPENLITDVAFTPNHTYFVLHPQFVSANSPMDDYLRQQCTVTLHLGGQHLNDTLDYYTLPLPPKPSDSITEQVSDEVASLVLQELIGKVPLVSINDEKKLSISDVLKIIKIFFGFRNISDPDEDPRATITYYSNSESQVSYGGNVYPILFMIRNKRLSSVGFKVEQVYYEEGSWTPIQLDFTEEESSDTFNFVPLLGGALNFVTKVFVKGTETFFNTIGSIAEFINNQVFVPLRSDHFTVEQTGKWNLEATFRKENPGLAAPRAQPISLADYPPFRQLPPEVQEYLLQHFEGTANLKATNAEMWQVPEETSLLPNYPSPFNPETWIPYQLAQSADVSLTIYDIQGRVVRDLDLGHQRAGMYHSRSRAAYWDGRNAVGEPVASGVYFYTLKAGDFSATRKMLIRK